MIKRMLIAKVSAIAGSAAILVGALDPLEGAFIIFPGSGLIAFGACLAQTRHRRLTYWAFLLIVASFAALLIMTVLGGIGGHAPIFRSPWWSLVFLPYPVGWMMDIVGATYALSSLFTRRWGHYIAEVWVLAAVGLLIRFIGMLIESHLLPLWGDAAVLALSGICILGVYFSDPCEY